MLKGWLTGLAEIADDDLMVIVANTLIDNGQRQRSSFATLDELADYLKHSTCRKTCCIK